MGSAEGISTAAPCLHMLTTHRLTAIVRRNARVPLDARCSMSIDRRSFVATAAALAASAAVRPTQAAKSPDFDIGDSDPLGVRADFPIVTERAYLNSAYIAPMPRPVVAAGTEFLENKATRPLEVGELLGTCRAVRTQFARLVNATADEIGLLFSTAEGENVIAQGLDLVAGDNVVVDELHYPTEFVRYRALEAARGVELRIAKHRAGMVDASDFAPLIGRRTRIVSVAWVSHQNGFRHDMRPSRTWRMPTARCSTPTPSRRSGCSPSTCRRRE